jgi:acyl-CoA thioester hydrolase
MTHVYCRSFCVRGYEIGATYRIHDRVMFNYIQQAAFEASADAGYDTRRYDQLGATWVIRKQRLAWLAPVTFGDVVKVRTWVSDVSRVRSHREYELTRDTDQSPVGLAQADWVYIDARTLFPRRIPPEMMERFQPNGVNALDGAPPLEPAERVEGKVYLYHHRVKYYETDNLRHVNNANYINWLGQARLDALAAASASLELEPTGLHSPGSGLFPYPIRCEIEYFVPAVAGDQVEVTSRVVSVGESQVTWQQQVQQDGEKLAEARVTVCYEDLDRQPVTVPDPLLAALID